MKPGMIIFCVAVGIGVAATAIRLLYEYSAPSWIKIVVETTLIVGGITAGVIYYFQSAADRAVRRGGWALLTGGLLLAGKSALSLTIRAFLDGSVSGTGGGDAAGPARAGHATGLVEFLMQSDWRTDLGVLAFGVVAIVLGSRLLVKSAELARPVVTSPPPRLQPQPVERDVTDLLRPLMTSHEMKVYLISRARVNNPADQETAQDILRDALINFPGDTKGMLARHPRGPASAEKLLFAALTAYNAERRAFGELVANVSKSVASSEQAPGTEIP